MEASVSVLKPPFMYRVMATFWFAGVSFDRYQAEFALIFPAATSCDVRGEAERVHPPLHVVGGPAEHLRDALRLVPEPDQVCVLHQRHVRRARIDNRELRPWSPDETLDFLAASRRDPLCAAFVLAIAMDLRRGETVGLRWSDLYLDERVLNVRQQTQRRRGVLYDDPESRRRRAVPLPALCIAPLRWHRMRQAAVRA